ncbi:MAG: zinc ribbon domain-containing protein [Deltaproteobacteria bacterium]|nr:zinc ribbon domain-containing protein [Deltaproteobacteria bacterium]
MPIFEFKCRECKENFEVLFRNRDEKVPVVCPKCGSIKVERMMSAFAGKIGCGSCTSTSCGPS